MKKRAALCGSRKKEEFLKMMAETDIEAYVEEVVTIEYLPEEEVTKKLEEVLSSKPSHFLFTTGEGVQRLFQVAEEYGVLPHLLQLLKNCVILCRGYKTRGVLLRYGLSIAAYSESTSHLLNTLKDDVKIAVQPYGEEIEELKGRAFVLPVYRYKMDTNRMDAFIEKLLKGFYHGVLFTSPYQVRYTFARARDIGMEGYLANVMTDRVLVVAVGHMTAEELYKAGVFRVLKPPKERFPLAVRELLKGLDRG